MILCGLTREQLSGTFTTLRVDVQFLLSFISRLVCLSAGFSGVEMAVSQDDKAQKLPSRFRRYWKWVIPVGLLVGFLFLAAWLVQRALNSSTRQRQFQAWLDENLNADVSLLSSIRIRYNLLRDSRFYVNGLEVENPVPTFPGKFIVLREAVARAPFYSLYHLFSDQLELRLWEMKVAIEQNESGEWNIDGLMNPLSKRMTEFPFPTPLLSGFNAKIRESEISIRRRGFEMKLNLDLSLESGKDLKHVILDAPSIPFAFSNLTSKESFTGNINATTASARIEVAKGGKVSIKPENCEFRIDNLPCASLPFFLNGLPVEHFPGTFSGLVRITSEADGGLMARLEGEIRDAPLAMFGLPRTAPIRLQLPLGENRSDVAASIRLGPAGFGGFDLRLPLNEKGTPKSLELHSDVVSLEDLSLTMAGGASWPNWLSTMLPNITWRSGKWLGYGWDGNNFQMFLTRSTSGLNLLGEADLLGGKVKAAMSPGKDGPTTVNIAAGHLDAKQIASKLDQLIPKPWETYLTSGSAGLTWRGSLPGSGERKFWEFSLVLTKPEIDLSTSGEWWKKLFALPRIVAEALPDWGGGDPTELLKTAENLNRTFEQISIIAIKLEEEPGFRVEFIAQTQDAGEIRGWADCVPDGSANGELYLVGPSPTLAGTQHANPRFAETLALLSGTTEGLRMSFSFDPEKGLTFEYPFLQDAKRLRNMLDNLPGDKSKP